MIRRKVLCNMLLLYAATAAAADVHYSAATTLMQASNLNHLPTPNENEVSQTVRGTVAIVENSSNLLANLNSTVEAIRYSTNQAADSSTGQLVANALWYVRPGQLEWFVSNIYTQTAINSLISDIPANRQNVNAFSTGPNYYIRINRRTHLELEGRVEDYSYDSVDTDNNRMFAASRLQMAMTPSVNTNVNYESAHVKYDNQILNTSFDRNDVFLGLQYLRGVNSAELQSGYTRIQNDNVADVTESRYLIALQNQRTRNRSVRAEYRRNLSDTSSDLRYVTAPGNTTQTLLATSAALYVRTSTSVNFTNELSTGVFIVNARKSELDYLTADTLDQTEKGASITNLWNLGGGSSMTINGSYIETSYINLAPLRINDDYLYGMAYAYRFKRNISLGLRAE